MTNPCDDLITLATNHTEVLWRKAQEARITRNNGLAEQYADEARQWEDALRLAASRSATQVVDREAVARALHNVVVKDGAEGVPWNENSQPQEPVRRMRLEQADAALAFLRPAEPVEVEHPALEWSLSDDAKRRLSEIDENIRNAVIASPGMKAGGIQSGPNAVGEPVAWQWWDSKFAEWRSCSKFSFDNWEKYPHIKRRELYTHSPKSPDIVELLKLAYDNMFDGEAREQIRRKLFE